MERYTDEEIKLVAEAINETTGMEWDEYQLYLIQTIVKHCKNEELEERAKNIDIDDENAMETLEMDIYARVNELVSDQNYISFLEQLDHESILIFLEDITIKKHPEIIGIALKKLALNNEISPEEKKSRVTDIIDEIDDNYINENFEEILNVIEQYFKKEDKLDVLSLDEMFKLVSKNVELHTDLPSVAMNEMLNRVSIEDKKKDIILAMKSIMKIETNGMNVADQIGIILEQQRKSINEENLEDYILATLNNEIKMLTDETIPRKATIEIFNKIPKNLQEKGIDILLKHLPTFPNYERDTRNASEEKLELLFGVMDAVEDDVLKNKFTDFMEAIKSNTTLKEEDLVKKRIAEFYKIIGDESLLINISGQEMTGLFSYGSYDDKDKIAAYLRVVLNSDPHALTNNDFVSGLYQGLQVDSKEKLYLSLGSQEKEKLKKILDENIPKTEEPDMSKYDKYLEDLSDMDENTFNDFMNDLKDYRNVYGRFSERHCDYLMKQKIKSTSFLNQNLDKHFPVFKRAFEDKTKYVLEAEGIENYVVRVSDYGKINMNETGAHSEGLIKISEDVVKQMSEKFSYPINTMFHETKHAIQHKNLDDGKMDNAFQYRLQKEKILEKEFPKFYEDNYILMLSEVEARIYGSKRQYEYLKELGFNEKIIYHDGIDVFESYKENQKEKIDSLDTIKWLRKDENGKLLYFNGIFSRLVNSKPELVNKYPILLLEYDSDGARRPSVDILKDFDAAYEDSITKKTPEARSKLRILTSILRDASRTKDTATMQDIDSLLTYEPPTKISKRYRNRIIEKQILNFIKNRGKTGKVNIGENKSNEERREGFKQSVLKLNKFVLENPEDPISEKIDSEISGFVTKFEREALDENDKEVTPQERIEGMSMSMVADKESGIKDIDKQIQE